MSISDFFNAGVSQPWLFVAAFLTLAVVFVNGWSDAPNAIATAVSTRSIDARKAVIMAAILNGLGTIAMGFLSNVLSTGVAETVANIVRLPSDGNAVLAEPALIMISVAMLSILIFSTVATLIGFPSSESNELLGGLTGASIAYVAMRQGGNWFAGINWMQWLTAIIGIIASLIIGFLLGFVFVKLIELICKRMTRSKTTRFFDIAQDFSAGAMAFMKCYFKGTLPLYHIDAYRLENQNIELGLDEFIEGNGVCFIEWPMYVEKLLPPECLEVVIKNIGGDNREITLTSPNAHFDAIVSAAKEAF